MPELPETETIARDLDAMVRGATIAGLEVTRPDVLRETTPDDCERTIVGTQIDRVWRRAKLIVLDLAPAPHHQTVHWQLVVQPRFTGGLLVSTALPSTALHAARDVASAPADPYVCLTMNLDDGRTLRYRDVRRLGTVALMDPSRFATYSAGLGPEPLDPALDDTAFSVCVRSSRQTIKSMLMDQKRLAGVGNIYANEALWHAAIDPSREASSLSQPECQRLRSALVAVLAASIAARGTSFRDYRDARGERGDFVRQLAAYGRAGEPCQRCGRRLVGTHAIDGRSTVFCATCQH